jgi:hypothetical protein
VDHPVRILGGENKMVIRIRSARTAAVLVSLLGAGAAGAQPDQPRIVSVEGAAQVNSAPHPFLELRIEVLESGERRVAADLQPLAPGETRETFFEIDLENGTFRILSPEEMTARGFPPGLFGRAAYPGERGKNRGADEDVGPALSSDEEWPPPICGGDPHDCDDPCSGDHYMQVETWDPPTITLTRTIGTASWNESIVSVECAPRSRGSGSCWAANPSQAGTHWFTESCVRSGGAIHTGDLNLVVTGKYFNYDFGLPNKVTNVTTRITMRYVWGTGFLGYFDHTPTGEAASLLTGRLFESGSDNCL